MDFSFPFITQILKPFRNDQDILRVVLNATYKNSEHFLPAMELIFYLADKLASFKLTANSKAKALKAQSLLINRRKRKTYKSIMRT